MTDEVLTVKFPIVDPFLSEHQIRLEAIAAFLDAMCDQGRVLTDAVQVSVSWSARTVKVSGHTRVVEDSGLVASPELVDRCPACGVDLFDVEVRGGVR